MLNKKLKRKVRTIANIDKLQVVISADTNDLDRDLKRVESQLKSLEKYVKQFGSTSNNVFGTQVSAIGRVNQSLNTMRSALSKTSSSMTSALSQARQMATALQGMDGAEITVRQEVVGGGAAGGLAAAGSVGAASAVSGVSSEIAEATSAVSGVSSEIAEAAGTALTNFIAMENAIQAIGSDAEDVSQKIIDWSEIVQDLPADITKGAEAFAAWKSSLPTKELQDLAQEMFEANNAYGRLEKAAASGELVSGLKQAELKAQNLDKKFKDSYTAMRRLSNEAQTTSTNVRQVANNTSKISTEANKATKSFKDMGKSILSMKNIFAAVIGGTAIKGMSKMATEALTTTDGMRQLARVAGEEGVNAFNEWNTEVASGVKKSQLFGTTMNEVAKTMSRFTKMAGFTEGAQDLMDAAIVLQATTGRSLEDIEERFRSAFTGSVEAIENVLPGITRDMLNYQAAIQFGAQSYQSLNNEQQRNIMLQAILSETMAMTGGQITEGQMRVLQLRSSLAELRLAWGGVFAVIAEMIIPVLLKLANILMTVAAYVKAFFQLLGFGSNSAAKSVQVMNGNISSSAKGLKAGANNAGAMADNLTKSTKEAKKLKGALMGFDEINTLNMTETGGDTGGAGGGLAGGFEIPDIGGGLGDLDSLGSAFDDFNQKVEDAKKKILDFWEKFKTPIMTIAALISGVLIGGGIMKISGAISAMWAVVGPALSAFGFAILDIITKSSFLTAVAGFFEAMGLGVAGATAATVGIIVAVIAAVVGAIVYLWNTSETFRQSWIEVWENIKELLSSVWENILKPIFEAIGIALMIIWEEGLKPLWEAWTMIWEQISGILTDFLNFLMPIITAIIDWLGPKITPILQFLGAAFGTMVSVATGWLSGMFKSVADIIGNIRGVFNGIIDFVKNVFTGNWRGAWDAVKSIFSNIFDGFGNIAKAPINAVIGGVNAMIRGLNKVKLPDWVPVFGGKGINIPEIPRLARGGVVSSGQMFMAGEAGKEAIVPLEHNTQWAKNIGQLVAKELGGGVGQGQPHDINIELSLGSIKFGKAVVEGYNKLSAQEGRLLFNI